MDDKTKKAIEEHASVAPRLSPQDIEAVIEDEYFHIVPGTTTTLCVLTLCNGFNVTGQSAAASPKNFDEWIGRRVAREDAVRQIWQLEGYLLRQRLFEQAQDADEVNALLRSAYAIAKREGEDTNWEGFRNCLEAELVRQNALENGTKSVEAATVTARPYNAVC